MADKFFDRYVQIGGGVTLHYVEAGEGKPLIIIPSWSLTGATYKYQLSALSRTRRVIALDMRGHGESSTPENGYRVSRLAADLRALIETLDLPEVDLMGHSIGSSIIWSYYDLYGDYRLGRLVFVDQAPSVTAKPDWSKEERHLYGCLLPDLPALAEFYLDVLAAESAEATATVIARLFSPALPKNELLWFASEIVKLPRRHAADLLYNHCSLDWRDVIKTIRLPSLVVGAEASIFSAESQRWIAAQIPGAAVEIFAAGEGGSHFMCYENPVKFNALVEAFLA
ncbi:MAG: alpha/beta hydrolase [Rhodospirillaceae bacterium]|nr:alpha/beta hydrolase [Rhodospirillaceae bacterium]